MTIKLWLQIQFFSSHKKIFKNSSVWKIKVTYHQKSSPIWNFFNRKPFQPLPTAVNHNLMKNQGENCNLLVLFNQFVIFSLNSLWFINCAVVLLTSYGIFQVFERSGLNCSRFDAVDVCPPEGKISVKIDRLVLHVVLYWYFCFNFFSECD